MEKVKINETIKLKVPFKGFRTLKVMETYKRTGEILLKHNTTSIIISKKKFEELTNKTF